MNYDILATKQRHRILGFTFSLIAALLSLVVAAVYVASAYGGMADPVESAKWAVLGLGYPIALGVVTVLLVVWLCLRRWLAAAILTVALVATWGPLTTFSPFHIPLGAEEGENTFKVLTYNVMNFTDNTGTQHSPNRTIRYILNADADLVFLQEAAQTSCFDQARHVRDEIDSIKAHYPYYYNGRGDVVLLSKFPILATVDTIYFQHHQRVIGWDVLARGDTLRAYCCHLESLQLTESDKNLYRELTNLNNMSSTDDIKEVRSTIITKLSRAYRARAEQARQVRELIDGTSHPVILCGDFNDTPGSFAYRTIVGDDMRDAYAECAFGPTITYHCNRFYFRIDHILYRGDFDAVSIERGSTNASDHYPLLATFRWRN